MAVQLQNSPHLRDDNNDPACATHEAWQQAPAPGPRQTQFDMSISGRIFDGVRNLAILAGLWVLYSLVRSAAGDEFTAALGNSRLILELQGAVGLPHEAQVQSIFLSHTTIVRAANWYYMSAHFPVTATFVVWAWLRHRADFPIIRNTLILVTGIGLGLHLLFPLVPPRKLPSFVDTGMVFGPSPYDISAAEAANQLAAMPSLHVGWALLVALSVIAITRHRLRFLALLHPLVTAFVVVLTANHYWTDAIVAIILVIVSWTLVWRREQRHAEAAAIEVRIRSAEPLFVFDSGQRRTACTHTATRPTASSAFADERRTAP